MDINKQYEVVVYNGGVSRTITGKLLASLSHSEIRLYGKNATQLQTSKYPLLPKGTPFDVTAAPWHVIEPVLAGQPLEVIYDNWIKPNGITLVSVREINITGTFKTGKSLSVLKAAFVRAKLGSVSLALTKGDASAFTGEPELGIMYSMKLADSAGSRLWGVYEGTVGYSLLPKFNISGELEYNNYSWPVSYTDKLSTFKWLVFSSLSDDGPKFAIAQELLDGSLKMGAAQGTFSLAVVGVAEDVGEIRSVLNIAGCTDIVLGTYS